MPQYSSASFIDIWLLRANIAVLAALWAVFYFKWRGSRKIQAVRSGFIKALEA